MKTSLMIVACLLAGSVHAAENIQVGSNLAMPLWQSGGTARALAMGSTYVGIAEGSSTLLWNPAGLGALPTAEIGLHHNSGLGDSVQETAVLGMPLGDLGGFGASVTYVNDGVFQGRDASGNATSTYGAGDLGGSVGWGREWLPGLDLGLDVKANQQTLADQQYFAAAADLGATLVPVKRVKLGLVLSTLGGTVAGNSLTTGLMAGGSYDWWISRENQLLMAASTQLQLDGLNHVQLGLEDTINSTFAIRAGYQFALADQQLNGLSGFSAGLGVKVQEFSLDYAYVPFGDLGASNRLSLIIGFGGPARSDD